MDNYFLPNTASEFWRTAEGIAAYARRVDDVAPGAGIVAAAAFAIVKSARLARNDVNNKTVHAIIRALMDPDIGPQERWVYAVMTALIIKDGGRTRDNPRRVTKILNKANDIVHLIATDAAGAA